MNQRQHAFLPLLALLTGTACENVVMLAPDDAEAAHAPTFAAQDDALHRQLREEDGWRITPAFAADAPFGRAGVRFDADGPVEMQARASRDEGQSFGAWRPLTITFAEELAHNGYLDVAPDTTHVQVRFMAPVETRVSFLALELFSRAEAQPDELAVDTPGETEQGLAADDTSVRRSSWGALPSRCTAGQTPRRITVHHTVTPVPDPISMPARMRQIQAFHMNERGWCDIGYHFLVGQDGQIYEGRPERRQGAHASGANADNAGVSFIGDFESRVPAASQMQAGARILRALADVYGIALDRARVQGHRQVGDGGTDCPGEALHQRLDALVASARGAGSSPPSAPAGPGTSSFADLPPDHFAHDAVNRLRHATGLQGCGEGNFCPDAVLTRAQLALLLATLDGIPSGAPATATFADVPPTHWAFAAVEEQVGRGVLNSCGEQSFCPDAPISWAYVAVVMQRALSLPWVSPATPRFDDIPTDHWAFGSIESAAARDVVRGCSATRYCPGDLITRAQAAVMLVRAYRL